MPPLLPDALIDTPLRVEQTVPRAWVHKRSLDNVLVTEIRACGDDHFLCAGRLPTAHCFFNDAGRRPFSDILFYTELGRQASLAVSHAFLNVGLDDVFIFEGSNAAVADTVWRSPWQSMDSVVIDIRLQDLTRRKNNAVARVVTEHTMWVGSHPAFSGTGAFTIQPANVFQRLRKKHGPAAARDDSPIAAGHHGNRGDGARGVPSRALRLSCASGGNITISTPVRGDDDHDFTASAIVDQTHPYFFDHACDHVPGMLLLEACAQLAITAYAETTGVQPFGISAHATNFTQFVECDAPATLTAHVNCDPATTGLPHSVSLCISQQGALCGTTSILLALPAGL